MRKDYYKRVTMIYKHCQRIIK